MAGQFAVLWQRLKRWMWLQWVPPKLRAMIDAREAGEAMPRVDLSEWIKEFAPDLKGGGVSAEQHFRKFLDSRLQSNKNLWLSFDRQQSYFKDFIFHSSIRRLELHEQKEINIQNSEIREVWVTTNSKARFENCAIYDFELADGGNTSIELINCWIRTVKFNKASCGVLRVIGGGWLGLSCPIAGAGANVFNGQVEIKDLWLPKFEIKGLTDVQSFRSLRSYLLAVNNVLAAGTFHSAELRYDRKRDSAVARFFSYIYEALSDFGNSITRTVICAAIFYLLTTLTAYYLAAIEPPEGELNGWHKQMAGHDWKAQALRSAVFGLNAMFNPLGLLNSKNLLVAGDWQHSLLLQVIGLFGTLSLAFLVIAVRRRFKLE